MEDVDFAPVTTQRVMLRALPIPCRVPRMNETLESSDAPRLECAEPARLIVWEKDGAWARHLKRWLAADGPHVYEVRTFQACREMLAASPASLVLVQVCPSSLGEANPLAIGVRCDYAAARLVAVADRTAEPLRWRLLESGFVWLCTSPREFGPVMGIVRRHFASVPEPERTTEQRIWQELPWPPRG